MSAEVRAIADKLISSNKIMVFSKTSCPFCHRVKSLLAPFAPFEVLELNNHAQGAEIQAYISTLSGIRTVPQVFVNGKFVGGCDKTEAAINSGVFQSLLK